MTLSAVCEAQRPGPGIKVPKETTNDRAPKKSKAKARLYNPARNRKEQEAKKKKQRKEYQEMVSENRKHALEIQTPQVRERMKNNRKDSDSKSRIKRKKNSERSRGAARKYK